MSTKLDHTASRQVNAEGEHHVILGDFGREGTLRYFSEFSQAERRLITNSLNGDPFFDEYRRVSVSIVGMLRHIKRQFLRAYSDAQRPLDNRILVGAEGGPDPEDVLPPIVHALAPWILTAFQSQAGRVKLIIPCNSLAPLAEPLERLLRDASEMERVLKTVSDEMLKSLRALATEVCHRDLSVPSIPSVVIAEYGQSLKPQVAVLGTRVAVAAYRKEVEKRRLNVEVLDYTTICDKSFEQVIHDSISGKGKLVLDDDFFDKYTVICACTDVEIQDAIDSTTVFANYIAACAYHPPLTVNA
jgi:hypothetical protein